VSVSNSISRLADYYHRHGLAATIKRFKVAWERSLFAGRMVVLYCDLDERKLRPVKILGSMRVERIGSLADLGTERHREMTSFWSPKEADRNIRERFQRGASAWAVECDGRLAGYGWTIVGEPIAPYYFPLGPNDVQLFDFYVFPKYRGRALHWLLTGHILHTLAVEGKARAFADTHEWNQAQLASFKMTPFRPLGLVRTYAVFGAVFTRWSANPPAEPMRKGTRRADETLKALRSNE
jgi:GNAT superfamily N-acetyltransferase